MFRSFLFWIHLSAGLVAGSIIAVMSFTGAALAFEHEIVEWAERDVRRVKEGSGEQRSIDDLLARVREVAPADSKPAGVTVSRDPRDAVAVSYGREGTYYVDPYTGDVRPPTTTRTHDFMHLMEDWHRRLALTGDNRDTGRAITGACNAAFLVLALTGLYLWWPRQWTRRFLRPALWFNGSSGKARDWNWHNVIGFWSLPVLIVLTATGMVISYRWASDLPYRLVGEQPPVQGGPAAPGADNLAIERPEGATRLSYAGALAAIRQAVPSWQSITLREGLPRRRGGPGAGAGIQPGQADTRPAKRAPQPYSATVTADDGTPSFSPAQLVINPFTGAVLSNSGYADLTPGRKIRTWLRFLHTGQALGWFGQFIAALACLGGLVLVYTGFALSWRRFFGKKSIPAA
jgi:uncharacterized iron-regulated membrane protein